MSSHCDVREVALRRSHAQNSSFRCRLCRKYHPLRKCQSFLRLSIEKRLRAVLLLNYCPNCLAHEHSANSCLQDIGCHICTKKHHTLLHFKEPSQNVGKPNSKSRDVHRRENDQGNTSSLNNSNSSISSILSRHLVSLLPTVTVIVIFNNKKHSARALIDACSQYSRIEKRLVDQLQLKTYTLGNEVYSQLMLKSKVDPHIRLAVDARVISRLAMKTPSTSLNSSIISKFSHLKLADEDFHTSQGISLVLGNDSYSKILKTGVIPGENGLPLAQDTIFGWMLSGPCTQ